MRRNAWVLSFISLLVIAAILTVPSADAGGLLDLGQKIEELVADPIRNELYVNSGYDIIRVDMVSMSETGRVTAPEGVLSLAIAPDGSRLYASLADTNNVAVYRLPELVFDSTFVLPDRDGYPWGLAASSNRLYVGQTQTGYMTIIDTTTGSILFSDQINSSIPPFNYLYSSDGNFIVSAGNCIYGIEVWSVEGDYPIKTHQICGDELWLNAFLALSPDGTTIVVPGEATLRGLGSAHAATVIHVGPTGLLYREHTLPAINSEHDCFVRGVQFTKDGQHVILTSAGGHYQANICPLTVFRTSDWAPVHRTLMQGSVTSWPETALSANGEIFATGIRYEGYDTTTIEFFDVSSFVPNIGGVKVKMIDGSVDLPIRRNVRSHDCNDGVSVLLHPSEGVAGWGPSEPGLCQLYAGIFQCGPLFEPFEFPDVSISTGAWTTLSDAVLTRISGTYPSPDYVCGSPAIMTGTTSTIRFHGDHLHRDTIVESDNPEITVNSYSWVDWATMDVSITDSSNPGQGFEIEWIGFIDPLTGLDYYGSFARIEPPPAIIRMSEPVLNSAESAGSSQVEVVRTGSTSGQVTIDYQTTDGTATAGDDYTTMSGTLMWPVGDSNPKTIMVPILQDAFPEGPETFTVELSNPTGGALLGTIDTTEVIIEDDDSSTVRFTAATAGVVEPGGTVSLTVGRTGDTSAAGSVVWATADGTAVAGEDYMSDGGTFDWAAGNGDDKTINVTIFDDALYEDQEAFTVVLSSPGGNTFLGEPSTVLINISDNDVIEIVFSAASFSVDEVDGNATITAWRTGASNGAVIADFATADGTATAGSDYTAASGTLSWADGDAAAKTFQVPLIDDGTGENDETVLLALSAPTGGATIGTLGTATLTIEDNDGTSLQFTAASFARIEAGSSVTITVERVGGDTSGIAGIDFATADGTAVAGQDYVATSGALSWADGETIDKTFTVVTLDDNLLEGPENLILTLSNPTGNATLGSPTSVSLIIGDDDGAEIPINTETSQPQTRPVVAMAPDGHSVVVWESYLQDGAGWGIFGQRFDDLGNPAGTEFQINSTTTGDQRFAGVAMAADGAFTVVWRGSDASGDGIRGRRFNASGAPVGAEFIVNTTTSGDQSEPDVAIDGTGAALVVWQTDHTGNLEVRGRTFSAAGTATGNDFAINTTTANDQQLPSATGSGGGGFVVAWQSHGQDGPAAGVIARRFSSGGSPVGAEVIVNEWTSGDQLSPDVGQAADGSFVVVWEDLTHQDGMGSSIRARWFSPTAVPLGSDIQINSYWMDDQMLPKVASDGSGTVIASWESTDQDGSSLGVFTRTIDSSGVFVTPEIQLNHFVIGVQYRPAVARSDSGAYWATWASGGQDGSGDGIYGVFGVAPVNAEIFADGFELGNTGEWSNTMP